MSKKKVDTDLLKKLDSIKINSTKKDDSEKPNKPLNISELPFISQYKILTWKGQAVPNIPLVQQFNNNEIVNQRIVIKSFKIIPYYDFNYNPNINIYLRGALDSLSEFIPSTEILSQNFIYEDYERGTINFFINDFACIFPSGLANQTMLKDYDNMYYFFPEKIINMRLIVDLRYKVDISELNFFDLANPFIKVIMEVYTL